VSGDQTDFIASAGVTMMLGVARVAPLSDRCRDIWYGLKSGTLSDGTDMPIGMGRSQGEISCHDLLPAVSDSVVFGSFVAEESAPKGVVVWLVLRWGWWDGFL
jgi:hypothetical protein